MTVLSYLPQCIFLIPFSYLTLQVGLNVTFMISLLKSVFFAYVYITKQYIIWLCFGFELKKNLDLAFLHAIFCFEIHPCCSFSHCILFPVRIVLQPTQSFSCDGPLGLQFGDISSAEVNSLKHVFQYVYIRASLKYIFGSGIASQRRYSSRQNRVVFKVCVPMYAHSDKGQDLLHPLCIQPTCSYRIR